MLSNCHECGRPYSTASDSKTCPPCTYETQDQHRKVRAFLTRHPGSSVEAIADGTHVPRERVIQLLHQGKVVPATVAGRQCNLCHGRLGDSNIRQTNGTAWCRRCSDQVASQLRAVVYQK